MSFFNKEAKFILTESRRKELKEINKRWKKVRVTKLVRLSNNSHKKLKKYAKSRKMTMSKTVDHIINRYFKHQKLYEDN